MFPRLLLVLSAMVLLSSPAHAAESSSERYQESYALEAAYSYQRALEKLDGITPTGADAWLLPLRRGWLLYLLGRYEESVVAYDQAAKAALPGSLEATLVDRFFDITAFIGEPPSPEHQGHTSNEIQLDPHLVPEATFRYDLGVLPSRSRESHGALSEPSWRKMPPQDSAMNHVLE